MTFGGCSGLPTLVGRRFGGGGGKRGEQEEVALRPPPLTGASKMTVRGSNLTVHFSGLAGQYPCKVTPIQI